MGVEGWLLCCDKTSVQGVAKAPHTPNAHPRPLDTHTSTPTPNRCAAHGQYEQGVGLALEGRRLDKLAAVVEASGCSPGLLSYALKVCQGLVINRDFRQQVRGLCVCVCVVVRLVTGVGCVASSQTPSAGFLPPPHRHHDTHTQVLTLLISLYERSPAPDYGVIAQCLMFLDDAPRVARILDTLARGSEVRGCVC
jgi:26S proteasome regulatory subunit N2